MKKKILVVGEIIWDIYPDKQVIGGAPLNFAAHATLCGAESAILSAVGNDELGENALQILADFGLSAQYVKKNSQPTGQCLVTLDQNAVPSYRVLENVAYDNIVVTEDDIARINQENYDALYFGTLIQRAAVSQKTVWELVKNGSFREIICDVNLRPNCYDAESAGVCLEDRKSVG